MIVLRIIIGLLLLAGLGCFAAYIFTGQVMWRRRGIIIVSWTLVAAFGFFAVLIVQRLIEGQI